WFYPLVWTELVTLDLKVVIASLYASTPASRADGSRHIPLRPASPMLLKSPASSLFCALRTTGFDESLVIIRRVERSSTLKTWFWPCAVTMAASRALTWVISERLLI